MVRLDSSSAAIEANQTGSSRATLGAEDSTSVSAGATRYSDTAVTASHATRLISECREEAVAV